jgi:hypothetical protein
MQHPHLFLWFQETNFSLLGIRTSNVPGVFGPLIEDKDNSHQNPRSSMVIFDFFFCRSTMITTSMKSILLLALYAISVQGQGAMLDPSSVANDALTLTTEALSSLVDPSISGINQAQMSETAGSAQGQGAMLASSSLANDDPSLTNEAPSSFRNLSLSLLQKMQKAQMSANAESTTEAPSTEAFGSLNDMSNTLPTPASESDAAAGSASGMGSGSNTMYPESSSASIMAISAASACAVFVAIM